MTRRSLLNMVRIVLIAVNLAIIFVAYSFQVFAEEVAERIYRNQLTLLDNPPPLLADFPEFVQPVTEHRRYEAPPLVEDANADLHVRAWRFSYNVRGIIEIPNRLRGDQTAVIVVHPWGIDDGQGWCTPEPAGAADFCTPEKNLLAGRHTHIVINPLLKRLRPHVGFVMYSLRGREYPIHKKAYRSIRNHPTPEEQAEGQRELRAQLQAFNYRAEELTPEFRISTDLPVVDYFQNFKGLQFDSKVNNPGFWDMAIPVTSDIELCPDDVVIYDQDGYESLKEFLKHHGIRHVLLAGYSTDLCYRKTAAGFDNLSRDFNVFLVGDATLATFPANLTPRYATNAAISLASINQLITQTSWIRATDEQISLSSSVQKKSK